MLSSTLTVVVPRYVTVPSTSRLPPTVKLPVTSAAVLIVTFASATVTFVAVALSSIPTDAKSEIVPPSILLPEIWLSASVNVPAETFNVLPEPTVMSDVAIVAPSMLPPFTSIPVNAVVPSTRFDTAVAAVVSLASTSDCTAAM
jgi:hypothetical protein